MNIDPYTGLPKKKNAAPVPGPFLSGNTLDPAIQGRINGGGATAYSGPGDLTVPGFTPDYNALIQGDPLFKQLREDLKAQTGGDLASRNAALNRLFTGFGALPDINAAGQSLGINDLGQAIDPATAQLAAENQFSTQANLGRAHTDAIRQIRQGLAARHALQSGELGHQLGRENTAYGNAQSQASQALLDSIAQLQGQFTAGQRANQQQLSAGAQSAADRQIGLNPATGSQKAVYDPSTGKYKGANGEWYNPDGTPYQGTPPPLEAAPPPTDNGSQAGATSSLNAPGVGATNNDLIYQALGRRNDLSQFGF